MQDNIINILFLGDIIGRPGRRLVCNLLNKIVLEEDVHVVIANGENAAGGFGITRAIADDLFDLGIDVITSGNHIWDKKEIMGYLDQRGSILRPLNFPPTAPGHGSTLIESSNGHTIGVINLTGRVFMGNYDCPFRAFDKEFEGIKGHTKLIIVDMHAEATSEKNAMGWYLDGRVSAVIGTHTHVSTADERILPGGTAYISDVGMCGSRDSVIGIKKDKALKRFIDQIPQRFDMATKNLWLDAVLFKLDPDTGKCCDIKRINRKFEE